MFKCLKLALVLSLIMGSVTDMLFAQGDAPVPYDSITTATPQLRGDDVVITGEVICLGCSLKQEKQAKAQCSIYGHINALLIEKVINAQGKKIDEAKGKIYQFLHNDQSDKLITDHGFAGKTMVVVGKIYPEANILEVNFFKEK